jgi:hypothetical protein
MGKNFKENYKKITNSDWFKKAYEDKSVGDMIQIEDALESFSTIDVDEGTYIVSRRIDSKAKTIVITVEPYAKVEFDRLMDASTFENSDEDFINLDADLDEALTTARVYKRAYEELFYRGYDVEIVVKGGGE